MKVIIAAFFILGLQERAGDTRVKPEYDDMVIQLLGYIISDRHIVTRNPVHCLAVNIDSTTKRHFGYQSAVD